MAKETIEADGKSYVLSKLAAKQTGYTQDYIGQLSRSGEIDAKRLGGLWYVNLDSLAQHKKDSEAYVPVPPAAANSENGADAHSIVGFDGQEYVSSKHAAELVNYTQDYVGQLARGGKVRSKQQNGRWYVSKDDIRSHKARKDAMLAEVQAQSLGIRNAAPAVQEHRTEAVSYAAVTQTASRQSEAQHSQLLNYVAAEGSDLPPIMPKKPQMQRNYVSRDDISDMRSTVRSRESSAPRFVHDVPRDPAPGLRGRLSDDRYDDAREYPVAVHTMGRHAAASAVERAQADQQRMSVNGYTLRKSVWDIKRRDELASAASMRRGPAKASKRGPITLFVCIIVIAAGAATYAAYLNPASLEKAYDAVSRTLGGTLMYTNGAVKNG